MSDPSFKELSSMANQWLDEPQPSAAVFTAGPMVPERESWLAPIVQPWTDFFGKVGEAAVSDYDNLPARLFDWGMDKLGGSTKRTVQQGAGTSITYNQQKYSGGAPADPNYVVLPPGQQQGGGGIVRAQPAGLSTLALVGIGLVILLAVRK